MDTRQRLLRLRSKSGNCLCVSSSSRQWDARLETDKYDMTNVFCVRVVATVLVLCALIFGAMGSRADAGSMWRLELPTVTGQIQEIAVARDGSIFLIELRLPQLGKNPNYTTLLQKLTPAGTRVWETHLPYELNNARMAITPTGDVILADADNRKIWRLSANGQTLSPIAGTGAARFRDDEVYGNDRFWELRDALSASFDGPRSVVADSVGDLFFIDQSPNGGYVICKLSPTQGTVKSVARHEGQGVPSGEIAISRDDALYIADTDSGFLVSLAARDSNDAVTALVPVWDKRLLPPPTVPASKNQSLQQVGSGGGSTTVNVPTRLQIRGNGEIIFRDHDRNGVAIKRLASDRSKIDTIMYASARPFSGLPQPSNTVSPSPFCPLVLALTNDGGILFVSPERQLYFIGPDDELDSHLTNLVYAALGKTRSARHAQQELELLANPDIARSLWSDRTDSNLPKYRIGQLPADLLPQVANYRASQPELLRGRIAFTTYQRLKDDSKIAPELTETRKRKRDPAISEKRLTYQ